MVVLESHESCEFKHIILVVTRGTRKLVWKRYKMTLIAFSLKPFQFLCKLTRISKSVSSVFYVLLKLLYLTYISNFWNHNVKYGTSHSILPVIACSRKMVYNVSVLKYGSGWGLKLVAVFSTTFVKGFLQRFLLWSLTCKITERWKHILFESSHGPWDDDEQVMRIFPLIECLKSMWLRYWKSHFGFRNIIWASNFMLCFVGLIEVAANQRSIVSAVDQIWG